MLNIFELLEIKGIKIGESFKFQTKNYKVNSKGEIINLSTNKKEDIFLDMLEQPFRIYSYTALVEGLIDWFKKIDINDDLEIQIINTSLKKEISKKVTDIVAHGNSSLCPECKKLLKDTRIKTNRPKYCPHCGQKLDWSETNHD